MFWLNALLCTSQPWLFPLAHHISWRLGHEHSTLLYSFLKGPIKVLSKELGQWMVRTESANE